MSIDERSQAALLEQFLLDPAAAPPTGLDAGIAATATLLAERLSPAGPSPEFVRKLEQQLTTPQPAGYAGTLPPVSGSMASAPATVEEWKPRPRRIELLRIAAAGLIILLLGSLLIYLFSNQDDRPQVAAPGGGIDGELLVSWDPRGGENYKLYIVPADGSEPRKLTPGPHEDDGVTEEYGTWSPDGRWVAYTRKDGDKWELHVAPVDRHAEPLNLTLGLQSSIPYGWSPDGTQILFSSRGEHNIDIHVMNSDGTNVRNLTGNAADGSWGGAWSPDGRQIAFSMFGPAEPEPTGPRGEIQTWVMDVDGSNQRQLTALPALVQAPVWSPDGEWLTFWYGSDIWIINPDGENLTNLTNDVLAYDEPAWSHGQNQIVYASGNMAVGSSDIVVIDTDGNIIQQWTPDADILRTPTWSPDDQHFAYPAGNRIDPDSTAEPRDLTFNDYDWRLEIATIDGNNRHVLLEGGINTSRPPAWKPAGNNLPPVDDPRPSPTEFVGWPDTAQLGSGDAFQTGRLSSACDWFGYPVCNEGVASYMVPDEPLEVAPQTALHFQVDGISDEELSITSAIAVPITEDNVRHVPDEGIMFVFDPSDLVTPLEPAGDALAILSELTAGVYALQIEVTHTSTEGRAIFGFYIHVDDGDSGPSEDLTGWVHYGDQSQRGELFPLCMWPGTTVCLDPAGFAFPDDILEVPAGAALTFSIDGLTSEDLANIGTTAHTIDENSTIEVYNGISHFMYTRFDEVTIPTTWSPTTHEITVDLPPGEYAVAVWVVLASGGGATYGFHIRIGGEPESSTGADSWPQIARLTLGSEFQEGVLGGTCGWFDNPECNDELTWMFPVIPLEVTPEAAFDLQVIGLPDEEIAVTDVWAIGGLEFGQSLVTDMGLLSLPTDPDTLARMVEYFSDSLEMISSFPPGDYAIAVKVRHLPSSGTAYFRFHIRVSETGPEGEPQSPVINNFPTIYDDAEVLYVVSVMVNVVGQEFETHTWVNQTNGDAIIQRYMDGVLWETLLRQGNIVITYNQESIHTQEYLSASDADITRRLFLYREALERGTAELLGEEVFMGQPALKVDVANIDDQFVESEVVWLDPETLLPLGYSSDSGANYSYPVVEALPASAMPNEIFEMDPPSTVARSIHIRQLTIDETKQFPIYPVWWLGETWNGFQLQRISHSVETLTSQTGVMRLIYVDTETGVQGIVISLHGELVESQTQDWQEAAEYSEPIVVGEFSGWLYESTAGNSAVLHLEHGIHYLKIDAPDRETALQVVEQLMQMNEEQ